MNSTRQRLLRSVDIQNFHLDETTAAAAADLQRHERRMTYVYAVVFLLVSLGMIWIWLQWTVGERACKRWKKTGEPRLEAVTVKMTSHWRPGEVTCDDEEALRYLEACLATAVSQPSPTNAYFRRYNECSVALRFADGAEYRSPGPCEITAEGIQLPLPSEKAGLGYHAFQDPMPDGWKHVLNTLLGAGTVK
ncbi:MAG: hypothetical protein GXX96_31860 [Planctomycetaceae bacterium]|nr:hypothetical protein [Planctomycetaceae bacterium]